MSDNPQILAAQIAAFASLIVALITQAVALRNQRVLRELEKFKSEQQRELETYRSGLGETSAENAARRDYVYEARKRLYQEYEPLVFQLLERSENTINRIHSLARSSRQGVIGTQRGSWLAAPDGYYMLSTLYNLIAPLAVAGLIQRKLTFVDLNLDSSIYKQYILAKHLTFPFTSDFDLAKTSPSLPYDPFIQDWQKLRMQEPQKFWRQGIPVGRLEVAVETLLTREDNGPIRVMSYGQFESAYFKPNSDIKEAFLPLIDIFLGFHPQTRPVLWRILITQAYLCRALVLSREHASPVAHLDAIPLDQRAAFDWRSVGVAIPDKEVLDEPFVVAQTFLRSLPGLRSHVREGASSQAT